MLKSLLQGKWLGHPLHPAVVHLPTALFPAALIFDLLSLAGAGGNAMVRTSFAAVALGLLAVLPAAPTGLADWLDINRGRPAWRLGLWHMALNVVVGALFAINLLLRWPAVADAPAVTFAQMLLSLAGVAILAVSGYLGGRMVYDQGTGVARFSKHRWRRVAIEGGARVPEEKD